MGYLVYGPYLPLRAGKYVAAFTITGTGTNCNEQLGAVDVNGLTSAKPENQINFANILAIGSEQIIPIPFIVDNRNVKFEFRVMVNGTGQVEYKGVRITKIV